MPKTDQPTNEISYPFELVNQLWLAAKSLSSIGCSDESLSLLEKVVSYSNYTHQEAIETLIEIYQKKPSLYQKLLELWNNALLAAFLNENDQDIFKYFLKIYKEKEDSRLQTTLTLYARNHYLKKDTQALINQNNTNLSNIAIIANVRQSQQDTQLLELLASHGEEDEYNLSFYFIDDQNSQEKCLTQDNYDYLKNYSCKVIPPQNSLSISASIEKLIQDLYGFNPHAVIFFEPTKSGLISFMMALRINKIQIALAQNNHIFSTETDLIITSNKNELELGSIPLLKLENFDNSFFNKIIELSNNINNRKKKNNLSTNDKLEANQDLKKESNSQEFVKESTNSSQKNFTLHKTLSSQAIQDSYAPTKHSEDHPLFNYLNKKNDKKNNHHLLIEDEKENFSKLSDTGTSVISKKDLDIFWEKCALEEKASDMQNERNDGLKASNTLTNQKAIDEAVKALQINDVNNALEVLSNMKDEHIRDNYYVKALCYTAKNDLLSALDALEIELLYFPTNKQASLLRTEIKNILSKKNNYK